MPRRVILLPVLWLQVRVVPVRKTANPYATETSGDENKAIRLGGGYTMDAFTVNAIYEQINYTSTAGATRGD